MLRQTSNQSGVALLLTLTLTLAGAGTAAASSHEGGAEAKMHNRDGESVGSVMLRETPNGVLVHATFTALPGGTHAFHFHESGQCEPTFKSAGGHFNPDGSAHGFLVEDGPHAGDMPNIHVPDSGELEIEVMSGVQALMPDLLDDDGAAFIVHDGADDYSSQPSGAAGARIACGVIEAK